MVLCVEPFVTCLLPPPSRPPTHLASLQSLPDKRGPRFSLQVVHVQLVAPSTERFTGVVEDVNDVKGFGFLRPDKVRGHACRGVGSVVCGGVFALRRCV